MQMVDHLRPAGITASQSPIDSSYVFHLPIIMLRSNASKAVPGCTSPCGRVGVRVKGISYGDSSRGSLSAVTRLPAHVSTSRSRCTLSGNVRGGISFLALQSNIRGHSNYSKYLSSAANSSRVGDTSDRDGFHDRPNRITQPKAPQPIFNKPKPFESITPDNSTLQLTPEQQHKLQAALADLAHRLAAAAAGGTSPAANFKTPQTPNTSLAHGAASTETPTTTSSSGSRANQQDAALSAQHFKDILNDWTAKYLGPSQLQPILEATSSHDATGPNAVIKPLFELMQLLLQKPDDANTSTHLQQHGAGRSLAAAAAAAAAATGGAGASASKPVQSADRSPAGTLAPSPAPTDTFDPDVWEATAAAAAAAINDDTQPDHPKLSSSNSSGSITSTKQASDAIPGAFSAVETIRDTDRPALSSSMCWPVELLAQAMAQAAAAAAIYQSSYANPSFNPRIISQDPSTTAGGGLYSVAEQLLTKPATAAAVDDLLLLQPVDRAAVLLLLCIGDCGSRGGDWLSAVLGALRGQLGLLEMGLMLAAVHRFGSRAFRAASRQLLPLTHPKTDPLLSLTPSHSAPLPAAALQALLLHWLLLSQLAAAGLPALPEQQIVLLLQEVMLSCNSRQMQLACRWGEVWPLTQLAADYDSSTGSSSSSSSACDGGASDPSMTKHHSTETGEASRWQLHEATLDASLLSNSWGGLTGISLDHVAHVIVTAAAALLPGQQHSSSSSGSSRQMATAAAGAELTTVARALIFGFQPLQPMLLLLMHRVQQQLLPAAANDGLKQQLQQVLLEASSSTGSSLAAPSLADLIHSDLGITGSSSSSGSSRGESLLIAAAISLFADLAPDQLRSELLLLLDLQQEQQWAMQGYCLAKPDPQNPYTLAPNIYLVLVGLAEATNPDQAAVMLEVVPMPAWSAIWAVFVGPSSGSFCWDINGLAAALARLVAAGGVAVGNSARGSSSSGSNMEELKAAWAVVAAHFALREVQGELKQVVSAGSDNVASRTQQQQQWTVGPTYTYQPGVPFVGDGWDQDSSSTSPSAAAAVGANSCFKGGLSSLVDRVLSALQPAAAAMHIAALAAVLPADAFARLAAHLLSPLNNNTDQNNYHNGSSDMPGPGVTSDTDHTSYIAGTPSDQHSSTTPLLRSLKNLHKQVPNLPRQPLAVQLLAAVSAHLPLDQLPSFLAHSDQITKALCDLPWIAGAGPRFDMSSSDHEICGPDQQCDLILAAAAVGRDSTAVQHMLIMLVDQSSAELARAAVDVLGGGVPEAVLLEATQKLQKHATSGSSSSSSFVTGFEREMIWQMGQVNEVPTAAAAAYDNADHALVRRLSDIVSDIPAAVSAGSWSMDAMQDPQRIAGLLQQLLSLLTDWTPSCPAAAAAVGQLVTTLITKRSWSATEAGAVMQRFKLSTALQLLLEGSSSSGSSSWITRNRSKLLVGLMDWHGFEATVDAIRALIVQYDQVGIADFAMLMADLQPAVAAAAASSGGRELCVHGVDADCPNLYIAALLHTLGLIEGMDPAGTKFTGDISAAAAAAAAAAAGSSVKGLAPAWSHHLSQMLCRLAAVVPEHVISHLAEQISTSLVRSGEADSILAQPISSSSGSSNNQAFAPSSWQTDLGMLLAELPVAAAIVAGKGVDLWGPCAVALCCGAAAAAGGAAVLPALGVACGGSTGSSSSERRQHCKQVATHLPYLLQQLQEQGVLTCSIGSSSSSSTATPPGHSSAACISSSSCPAASGCINLQLVLLLQQLHKADKCISLSTAVKSLIALSPTLGKALPQALVQVVGHTEARGYGGLNRGMSVYNPDAAEALEQLQASLQAAAAAVMPTGAAVSTAAAVAGKQLSEVLVYCHEMIPDQITAIATVLPWHQSTTSSSSSSRAGGAMFCPAEIWYDQDGWAGVTQTQLITSSLLTAACAMWGVDKGTHVANSLITKLVAAAAAEGVERSADLAGGAEVQQHSSSAAVQDNSSSSSASVQWQSQKATKALLNAAASGEGSTTTTTDRSTTTTATHAGRAEASLLRAAGVTSAAATPAASDSHARRAAAALMKAAASGAVEALDAAGTRHASLAQQKLITAAMGTDSSSSSSRAAMLWAVQELTAAAGHLNSLAQATDGLDRSSVAAAAASRNIVSQLLSAGYSPSPAAGAAAAAGGSSADGADSATALLEALSFIWDVGLPFELVVQVLVQCEGSVSDQQWEQALATALDNAAVADLQQSSQQQQQQLLIMLVQEVQLTVRVNAQGPRIYASVLAAAAAAAMGKSKQLSKDIGCQVSGVLQPLLHLMLTGSSSTSSGSSRGSAAGIGAAHKGVALSASAAAQLVLELVGGSSSSSSSADSARREINNSSTDLLDLQLLLLSQVVPVILDQCGSSSSSSGSSSLPLFVACVIDRISTIANPVQQMYILLLLQPHLTQQQLLAAVADTPLAGSSRSGSSVDATVTAAAAVLHQLCSQSGPGKKVPLASYAEILAAALDLSSSSSSGVSRHESELGHSSNHPAEQWQQQQQLIAAVAAVLGSFRGMRSINLSNPTSAHLLLPLSDLAAVLCYSKMLLPAATADHLAAALAATMSADQLDKLLLLLPQAASYGFGKGSELWLPLLHTMSVAAGLTDAAESDLARKISQVAVDQAITAPVTIPCYSAWSDPATKAAAAAAAHSHSPANDSGKGPAVQFAGSAAVNAAQRSARAAAAANNSPTAAAAAIKSHPISCDDQNIKDSKQSKTPPTGIALDALGMLSLLFVGAIYCGPVAALYRAAIAGIGLSWAGATLLPGLLEELEARGSSNSSTTGKNAVNVSKGDDMPPQAAPAAVAAALGGLDAGDAVPPESPRTPTIQESRAAAPTAAANAPAVTAPSGSTAGSSNSSSSGSSRNKSIGAPLITPDTATTSAADLGSAAGSSEERASAVEHMLGSLYVDSDEAVRRISTAAGEFPLDQAMMMVVPLLLQQGSSSSSPWPLLAIDAVVRAKHPAVSLTLSGRMTSLNLAIAAAIDMPGSSNTSSSSSRSPLSSLLAAGDRIKSRSAGFKTLDDSWQQHQSVGSSDLKSLDDMLTAAEAVDPWAVSMQICSRFINALWDALMGSCTTASSSSSSSSSSWGYDVSSPDGAAAAWQTIITDLLRGSSKESTMRLLSEFVTHSSSSSSSWEAALRAMAVATALQEHSSGSITTNSSSRSLGSEGQQHQSMFTVLLQAICSSRNYPPLAFLVLLLQQQQVKLSSSDVATVMQAALDQLLTAHGTTAAAAAAVDAGNSAVPAASSPSSRGSRAGDLLDFTDGDFDFWGFEALFKDLDLFSESQQKEGPQYQPTSKFAAAAASGGSRSSSVAAAAVPAAAMESVTAIVKATITRGYSVEALDFIACLLLLVDTQQQTSSGGTASYTALKAFGSSRSSSSSHSSSVNGEADVLAACNSECAKAKTVAAKLVLDHNQMSVLLSLAADCCAAALPPGGSSSSMSATALLPTVVPDLAAVLADRGDAGSCVKLAAAVCEAYRMHHTTQIRSARDQINKDRNLGQQLSKNLIRSSGCSGVLPWADARLLGKVISAAAAAAAVADIDPAETVHGSAPAAAVGSSRPSAVSAVKPHGGALLGAVSAGLFGGVSVEQCLVILADVAAELPVKLGLQLVAASAAKLHSVMPQAVAVVRSSSRGGKYE